MKLASNTVNFNSGIEDKKKEKEKNGLPEKGEEKQNSFHGRKKSNSIFTDKEK